MVVVLCLTLMQCPEDLSRFPTQQQCEYTLEFGEAYIHWLEHVAMDRPDQRWQARIAINDVQKRLGYYKNVKQCWSYFSQYDGGEDEVSSALLGELNKLRKGIGEEAYWTGRLPLPVPPWALEHEE